MRENNILVIDSKNHLSVLKGLATPIRLNILAFIQNEPKNVNEIAEGLGLPQSTVAANVMALESVGLVKTQNVKGRKGTQKVCSPVYTEMVIKFADVDLEARKQDIIEVEMPIGLYTRYTVSAPCGLCAQEGIVGYLDVADSFLDPGRMKAGLIWFEMGYLEYKFPNNTLYKERALKSLEVSAELSSEAAGPDNQWLSDISVWVNDIKIGCWESGGVCAERRGKYTPSWWKRDGSQYGLLKQFRVTDEGSFVDGVPVSDVQLADLKLPEHHSITIRIGVQENAANSGGLSIFGRGFGDYEQDLILRLAF